MKAKAVLPVFGMIAILAGWGGRELAAQSKPLFVPLENSVIGALYLPDSGPAPRVGIVVMHRESDYTSHIACTEFSKRGFAVLCMNSRFVNNESSVSWEQIPLDVAQGVKYLKNVQRVSKVVLWGSSGGGVTMSFYQAVAEKGPSICQGPKKLVQCGNNLAGLPPADGIILADGHPGNPILRLRSLNPSLSDSDDLAHPTVNPLLDPFSSKNGYNPEGPSKYSGEFKEKYFRAQAERMNHLIDLALKKLQQIQDGKDIYTDDAPFNIPGFDNARLLSLDLSIRHTTLQPQKLLKNDGTVVKEVIANIAPPRPELARMNRTFQSGARGGLTVKSFLSSNAIRATNSMDEEKIDLCSTNNSTPCMLQQVTAPILVAAMQASFQNLLQEMERNYLSAKSKDKDFIVVEGATTGVTPCTTCGGSPEQYSNVTKNFFDYAAAWIRARF